MLWMNQITVFHRPCRLQYAQAATGASPSASANFTSGAPPAESAFCCQPWLVSSTTHWIRCSSVMGWATLPTLTVTVRPQVLFHRGVHHAGLQQLHLLPAAYHRHAALVQKGNNVAAVLTTIEFHTKRSFPCAQQSNRGFPCLPVYSILAYFTTALWAKKATMSHKIRAGFTGGAKNLNKL